MKQALIINVTRMGDLIQTGPLLSRLREEWPDVEIDLVVDRSFASTAALLTGIRAVISCDFTRLLDDCRTQSKSLVALMHEMTAWAAPLRAARYDRIINLTFNRQTGLLASYIGAPDLRGITAGPDGGPIVQNSWLSYFTDLHRHRQFNRFNLVDLYAMGGSGPGAFSPLSITVPADGGDWADRYLRSQGRTVRQWIAVQAGASDVMKAWRPESFGLTMARLSRHPGLGFVMIGTAAETESIELAKATYRVGGGAVPILDTSGHTTLSQLVGLLSRCQLLLTNDTGPMHLAVGVGTTVLDLSVGHVDHQETGPYGPGHWAVQPDLACSPCGFDQICAHHACKDRLIPDEVAMLCLHALGLAPFPSWSSGVRVYQSSADADGLGCFTLRAGHVDAGCCVVCGVLEEVLVRGFHRQAERIGPDLRTRAGSRTCDRVDERSGSAVAPLGRAGPPYRRAHEASSNTDFNAARGTGAAPSRARATSATDDGPFGHWPGYCRHDQRHS